MKFATEVFHFKCTSRIITSTFTQTIFWIAINYTTHSVFAHDLYDTHDDYDTL